MGRLVAAGLAAIGLAVAPALAAGGASRHPLPHGAEHARVTGRGAVSATAVAARRLSGRTSQNEPYVVTVGAGTVAAFHLTIVDTCPGGSVTTFTDDDYNIPITNHRFTTSFSGTGYQVTIRGRINGGRVTGTVHDLGQGPNSIGTCTGVATFGFGRVLEPPFKTAYVLRNDLHRRGAFDLSSILIDGVLPTAVVQFRLTSPSFKSAVRLDPPQVRHGRLVRLTFRRTIVVTRTDWLAIGVVDRDGRGVERVKLYETRPSRTAPTEVVLWQACMPAIENLRQFLSEWAPGVKPVAVPCR